jgi:hypothetical protein
MTGQRSFLDTLTHGLTHGSKSQQTAMIARFAMATAVLRQQRDEMLRDVVTKRCLIPGKEPDLSAEIEALDRTVFESLRGAGLMPQATS